MSKSGPATKCTNSSRLRDARGGLPIINEGLPWTIDRTRLEQPQAVQHSASQEDERAAAAATLTNGFSASSGHS